MTADIQLDEVAEPLDEDATVALLTRLVDAGFDPAEVAGAMRSVGAALVPREQAVTVAYVNSNSVSYSWHHSMVELLGYDLANGSRVMAGGYIAIRYGTGGLVHARNLAVAEFLTDRPADWLLWIDTDMGFPADVVAQLLAAADPETRPIVGGLCFSMKESGQDQFGGWVTSAAPTIFDWAHEPDPEHPDDPLKGRMGFAVRWDYPSNALVQCAGTGAACILIHRSAFEKIAAKFGPHWYDTAHNVTMRQDTSEDLSFCMRAAAVDVPVYVHTGVRTTHQKTVWLGEEAYWNEQARLPKRPGQAVPRAEVKEPE